MPFNWNQSDQTQSGYMKQFADNVRKYGQSTAGKARMNTLANTYAGNDAEASRAFMDDVMTRAGGEGALSSSYRGFLEDAAPQIRAQQWLTALSGQGVPGDNRSHIPELADQNGGFFDAISGWLQGGGQDPKQAGFGFMSRPEATNTWQSIVDRGQGYENSVANGTEANNPNVRAFQGIINDPSKMQALYEAAFSMANPTYYQMMRPQIRNQFNRMQRPENIQAGNWLDWYLGQDPVAGSGQGRLGRNGQPAPQPLRPGFGF